MADVNRPGEYIAQALSEVRERDNLASELSSAKDREASVRKRISSTEKSRDKEIKAEVSSKRASISKDYSERISRAEKRLKEAKNEKKKEKSKRMNERIALDTSFLREENKELSSKLSSLFKENGIPAFCKSDLYYAFFMPKAATDFLLAAAGFILVFVLIPAVFVLIWPDTRLIFFAFLYILLILVFGGIYIFIGNKTKLKSPEAYAEGRAIKSKIRHNRSSIRRISGKIKKDPDEEQYGLGDFDKKIDEVSAEIAEIKSEREKALNDFDNDKAPEITEDIKSKYADKLLEYNNNADELSRRADELSAALNEKNSKLTAEYGAEIGENNLTEAKLKKLQQLVDSGEAESVDEAVAKLS